MTSSEYLPGRSEHSGNIAGRSHARAREKISEIAIWQKSMKVPRPRARGAPATLQISAKLSDPTPARERSTDHYLSTSIKLIDPAKRSHRTPPGPAGGGLRRQAARADHRGSREVQRPGRRPSVRAREDHAGTQNLLYWAAVSGDEEGDRREPILI